jgi:hypothetical protein
MQLTPRLALYMFMACIAASPAQAQQVGLLPVPVFQNAQIQAQTSFDAGSGFYTFAYTINNPATNTGQIVSVRVDVASPAGSVPFGSSGLTIPIGGQNVSFDNFVSILAPLNPPPMVPVGMNMPTGWNGALAVSGFAFFASGDPRTTGTDMISPGQTKGGFALISPGVPTIRQVKLVPFWVFLVDDAEATTAEDDQLAQATEDSLPIATQTLGPSAVSPGSFGHWNQLRDDLSQAIQLGWVADPALAATLVSQLASARQAEDASDGTTAKLRLQPLLGAVSQATASQIRQEARDLVSLNVQALVANTPDTPIPFEPKVTLSPKSSSFPLGGVSMVTASVVNIGDPTIPPIPGFPLSFRILDGPDAGQFQLFGFTGADGTLTFSYTGQQLGTDLVNAFQAGEVPADFGTVAVNWTGGPDLIIQAFIPPVINAAPGQSIPVTEITRNIGSTPAGPSVTRYFLSANAIADPAVDQPLGERPVPPLNPGESSQSNGIALVLPDGLPAGTYRLGVCADADQQVVELNELNNCRPAQVAIALKQSNQPPDCSKAQPSVSSLWPPNHKLVPITVSGITDPDGDKVTVTVAKITQDEPVNGLGDGDTSPDGFGVGTSQAQVRAERSGTGNGRVYAITFKADDGRGGTCNAVVKVGVPHDQGKGSVPIDDGQNFDSTLP